MSNAKVNVERLIERSLSHYGSNCSARCQPQTHAVCTTAHSRGPAARSTNFRLQYRANLLPTRLTNFHAERRRRQSMRLQVRSAKFLCHASMANIYPTTVGRDPNIPRLRAPRVMSFQCLACAKAGPLLYAGSFASNCGGNRILQATVGATFKLLLACGFVGWLLHTGRLSEDTAPVLSKVRRSTAASCAPMFCLSAFTEASLVAGGFQRDAPLHAFHQSRQHSGQQLPLVAVCYSSGGAAPGQQKRKAGL